jgi:hypothetical protein
MFGSALRRKTGPTPKYGPNQAKKMVSMRLSPTALDAMKQLSEEIFRDSRADTIEQVFRICPVNFFKDLGKLSKTYQVHPTKILEGAIDSQEILLEASKKHGIPPEQLFKQAMACFERNAAGQE